MAVTWIKSLHVNKGKSIAQTLGERTDYVENPAKTNGGELVAGYMCDPHTIDEEFLLSKREYEHITGRDNGRKNVLAYHIRQSFKPGETDAKTANEIGYELALRFTKGRHQFIVATHTDKSHIHNHIVFNSTSITCDRKFNDFKRSGRTVRRISDLLCVEYGLSVIENPQPSKGRNYAEWLGSKPPSWRELLKRKIDEVLPSCLSFGDFITAMKSAGYTVNDKRKYITFCAHGQKKPTRLKSLGDEYDETAIRERLSRVKTISEGGMFVSHTRVNLLINIQQKIQEGKGAGYQQWARIFNLREAAKTLLFLKENGIDSYDDLLKKSAAVSEDFNERLTKIKAAETRMAEISELQKYIGQYGKTRDVYKQYLAAKNREDFFEEHRAEITLHMASKKYFDSLGYGKNKKLPTIATLKQEYAILLADKKKLYSGYHELKEKRAALLTAKSNAQSILGIKPETQNQNELRNQIRSKSHEI